MANHDLTRDVICDTLKTCASVVSAKPEQFVHELMQRKDADDGSVLLKEARLDVDVRTVDKRYLLDVRLYHQTPLRGGQQCLSQEQTKFSRYKVHVNGRRVTSAVLVPVVVSSTGALGSSARRFFQTVGGRSGGRRLCELAQLLGVYAAAELQWRAYWPRIATKAPAVLDAA